MAHFQCQDVMHIQYFGQNNSIRPGHKHWSLDNFERLPVNMSSYSSTGAPSTTDLVIPTFDC